jgi:hypothetical protein
LVPAAEKVSFVGASENPEYARETYLLALSTLLQAGVVNTGADQVPEAVTVMVAVALCCQRAEAEAPPAPSSTMSTKAPTASAAPGRLRNRAI